MRAWPLLLLLLPSVAHATYVEEPKKPHRELEPLPSGPVTDEEPDPRKYVAVTWLPLQALVPLWSFSVEVAIVDRVSFSVFGGAGNTQVYVGQNDKERHFAWQVGGLLSYYVSGDFDHGGIHVGAAGQLTRVAGSEQLASSALRPGFLVGPLLGFKWVLKGGFTLDSQLGIGFVAAETSGSKPNDPDQKTALLGNFGVGWTF